MVESDPARTYEIRFDTGAIVRIDIPSSYKITFGPVVGAKDESSSRTGYKLMAFRAWETETKQRLLLTGVTSFRDISLPLQARAVRRYGTEVWFPDDGTWIGEKGQLVERAWKPIDEMERDDPEDAPKATKPDDDDEEPWSPKRLVGMSPGPNRRI